MIIDKQNLNVRDYLCQWKIQKSLNNDLLLYIIFLSIKYFIYSTQCLDVLGLVANVHEAVYLLTCGF